MSRAAQTGRDSVPKEKRPLTPAERLLEAQYASVLWTKPFLTDEEVPIALGIPPSTWQLMKAQGKAPPAIEIGRRRLRETRVLREWVWK